MPFNPRDFNIEDLLIYEQQGTLAKVCNEVDATGLLLGQYKTRVVTVPIGQVIQYGTAAGKIASYYAPALYRSFSYDSEGNRIASVPELREWTQACEDKAQGVTSEPISPFVGSGGTGGLPFLWDSFTVDRTGATSDIYNYTLDAIPTGTVTITYTNSGKCLISGATIAVL